MNYPSISEYIDAMMSAQDNMATLTSLRLVTDNAGLPMMTSGNFAVVFKMKDQNTGNLYAAKCFTREQEGRAEGYKMIADELEYVSSTFLTKFKYLERELFCDTSTSDEEEFPILLMDWVEGVTLDRYLGNHIGDTYALRMLAYQFSKLATWLVSQPFAHGDVKPDNILVRQDGTLVLVDYDGMYVPAMAGQKARELGSPDFRHPSRTEDYFNEHIDDFPLASMLLSLRAIANDSSLFSKYGADGRLLFSAKDYQDISSCQLLRELFPSADNEVNTLVSLFTLALTQGSLVQAPFRLLSLSRPTRPTAPKPATPKVALIPAEAYNTKVTKEDLANAWADEYRVKYSRDRKRLLKAPEHIETCTIKDGTVVICDDAFCDCESPTQITIPDSVTSIGERAFSGCESLTQITFPSSVTSIGYGAFSECTCAITSHSAHFEVVNNILYDKSEHRLISCCNNDASVSIPYGVTSIGYWAFYMCLSLRHIYVSAKHYERIKRLLPTDLVEIKE